MENEFRFFKLSQTARMMLTAACFLAGIALEAISGSLAVPGLVVAAAGWAFLMLKPVSNKPDDQGLEEWRAVTMAEIDRLDDAIRATRKTMGQSGETARKVFGWMGLLVFFPIVAAISFAVDRHDVGLLVANAAVFLAPAFLFGSLRLHQPKDIAFKMPSYRALFSESGDDAVILTPYLRFDKDSKGQDVPEDIRVMYETKRAIDDFVGIQVQCTGNKGPNGVVPYMYAVVLTRGRTGIAHRGAKNLAIRGFEVEAGGDDSYGTVVIRQATSGTGYHTTIEDCRKLGRICVELVGRMKAPA